MLSFWGYNHRLPFFHMDRCFIWLNEAKQRINEFTIGYMINTCLNVNKAFREQVQNFMYTAFGEITQSFIKSILENNNISVLALIMYYETREENPRRDFIVLSCAIYVTIKNYICIYYLSCQ